MWPEGGSPKLIMAAVEELQRLISLRIEQMDGAHADEKQKLKDLVMLFEVAIDTCKWLSKKEENQ